MAKNLQYKKNLIKGLSSFQWHSFAVDLDIFAGKIFRLLNFRVHVV